MPNNKITTEYYFYYIKLVIHKIYIHVLSLDDFIKQITLQIIGFPTEFFVSSLLSKMLKNSSSSQDPFG